MSTLSNEIVIAAPAQAVWVVVAHRFDRMGEWATAIEASTAHTGTPAVVGAPVAGRVCRTGLRVVPEVTETIIAYDETARTLTYEAGAGMPGFVRRARNRWQVTALDGGRSRVAFHAELEVRGPLGWLFRAWLLARVGLTGGYLLDDLRHYVEHGVPSPRKRPPADPVLAVGVWPTTRLLRLMLRANGVFSMVCGLLLVAAGWWVAAPWGLGPAVVPPAVGAGVAGFGVLVAWLAVQPGAVLRRRAVPVVIADLGWVAGSIGLLVTDSLPEPGAVAVGAVAAVVAGIAIGQVAGLAAVRGGDPLADVEIVQAERVLAAPPGAVWPLITDHGLYGRLAPNLSTVEVISEPGAPLRRRCVNTAGQGWEETCTLWEDGRRFAVEVDTTRYPYPLAVMRGLWQVDPDPAGSRIIMRFAYQAAPSVRGGLFAIALRVLFPLALSRILRGWQRRAGLTETVAGG